MNRERKESAQQNRMLFSTAPAATKKKDPRILPNAFVFKLINLINLTKKIAGKNPDARPLFSVDRKYIFRRSMQSYGFHKVQVTFPEVYFRVLKS